MLVKSLLNAEMKKGLQQSIYWELYQSNLWKSLANQLQRLGLFGSQKYFLAESAEELTHYQIIVEFMNDMGDCADLPKIDAIEDKVKNIGDALEIGYETETDVYNHYKDFAKDALKEDLAVYNFLQQFIDIQVKAVGAYGDLLAKYKIAEETKEILEFDEHISD
jgi:ferritin|tara:strand:- start:182 stop:673 length:492 start_codon:yes stop_codon:yes gene_type:complete